MHIYNITLNKLFLETIYKFYFMNNKVLKFNSCSIDLELDNMSAITMEQSSLFPIINSLKNESNIFIEVNLDNKNKNQSDFIRYYSMKEFFKTIKILNLDLHVLVKDNFDQTVLIIKYMQDNRIETGYLLHFGKDIFIILKNINSNISKAFAAIPILKYATYRKNLINKEEDFVKFSTTTNLKNTMLNILKNQLLIDHLHKTNFVFINDNRKLKIGSGKFKAIEIDGNTQYQCQYEDTNNIFLYDFICLTDGKMLTDDTLQNYFTIGTLVQKLSTSDVLETIKKNDKNFNSRVDFNLESLMININISQLKEALKLFGIEYLITNTLINSKINIKNPEKYNELLTLYKNTDLSIATYFHDLETLKTFINKNQDKVIYFVYKGKSLYYTSEINKDSNDIIIPVNVLKLLLTKLIEEKFLKLQQNFSNLVETYNISGNGIYDQRVKNIINKLHSGRDFYIINKEKNIITSLPNFKLQANDYIYYIEKTNSLILVNGKQLYTILVIYNGEENIFLYPLDIRTMPSGFKDTSKILYKVNIDPNFIKFKNFIENLY